MDRYIEVVLEKSHVDTDKWKCISSELKQDGSTCVIEIEDSKSAGEIVVEALEKLGINKEGGRI